MNITFEQQLEKLETSEEAKVIRIGKTEEEKRTDLEAYLATKTEEERLAGEEVKFRASVARERSKARIEELVEKKEREEEEAIEARRKILEEEKKTYEEARSKRNAWRDSLRVGEEAEGEAPRGDETSGERGPKSKEMSGGKSGGEVPSGHGER